MNKVYGGTTKSSESLCVTCRYALIIRGVNLQEIVNCAQARRDITFPVTHCHGYDDKRMPELAAMKLIAWEVHSIKRGQMGFVGNSDELITIDPPSRNIPDDTEPATQRGF